MLDAVLRSDESFFPHSTVVNLVGLGDFNASCGAKSLLDVTCVLVSFVVVLYWGGKTYRRWRTDRRSGYRP
jgi:hypothetical protein